MKTRSSSRHNRISNAHVFAVGRATGVRLNGSHAANTGAALHNAKKHRETLRKMSKSSTASRSSKLKFSSTSTGQSVPLDTQINFDELKNLRSFKFFYLLLIPVVIFLIITFIMMVLSIARVI